MNVALQRLNADGSPDASFNADGNSDGKIISNWGSWEYGEAVAVLPNGKFLVGANYAQNLAVAQYLSNGALDTANFNASDGVPGVAYTTAVWSLPVSKGKRGFGKGAVPPRREDGGITDLSPHQILRTLD